MCEGYLYVIVAENPTDHRYPENTFWKPISESDFQVKNRLVVSPKAPVQE